MEEDQLLDQVIEKKNNRFSILSLNALITTIIFLAILIVLSFTGADGPRINTIGWISFIGLLLSNLSGTVFTVFSYVKREKDTIMKTIVSIANLFLFMIVLTLVVFIILDFIYAGNPGY